MGNAPSSEAPRERREPRDPRRAPQKLSKPRVGNGNRASTNAGVSAPDGPRYSNSYLVACLPDPPSEKSPIVASPGAFTSDPSAESLGSPAPETEVSSPPLDPKSPLSPIPSLRSRNASRTELSRPATVSEGDGRSRAKSTSRRASLQPPARSASAQGRSRRGSGNYDMTTYAAQRLLGVEQDDDFEPPLPRRESLKDARDVADIPSTTSNSQQPADPTLTRSASETSLYVLVRRRSITQTPGVATRARPSKPDLPRKSSARNSHHGTPTQSSRTSLETARPRHQSLPLCSIYFDPSEERASTPCEADYKQLGGMKFGSLRITNGAPAASPTQERNEKRGHSSLTLRCPEYVRPDDPFTRNSTNRWKHQHEEPLETAQPRPILRVVSPISPISPTSTYSDDGDAEGSREPKLSRSPPPSLPEIEVGGSLSVSPMTASPQSPVSGLQITSKHTAQEDQLFEDEESSPEYSLGEVLDVKEDPSAKHHTVGDGPAPSDESATTVSRSDSGVESNSSSDASRKPIPTVDSGYGSINSLRSSSGSKSNASQPEQSDYLSSDTRSVENSDASPLTDVTIPTPSPLKSEDALLSPRASAPSTFDAMGVAPNAPEDNPSPSTFGSLRFPSFRAGNRDSRSPSLQPGPDRSQTKSTSNVPPVRPHLVAKAASTTNVGSGPRKLGMIQRLLSGSKKSLPSVYAVHDIHDAVPSIPSEVQNRLNDHNGRFPTASKRLALRTQPSIESLNTIMSVGDIAEVDEPSEDIHFAEPERDAAELKALHRRSWQNISDSLVLAATSVLPSSKPTSGNVIRRKPTSANSIRRKPVGSGAKALDRKTEYDDDIGAEDILDDEADAVTMDSVRRSIGNGAFDQALSAISDDYSPYAPARGPRVASRAPQGRGQGHQMRPHHLVTHASAPNLLAGNYSRGYSPIPEHLPVQSTKTPPPISMQNRSSKKSRTKRPLRRQSSPAGLSLPPSQPAWSQNGRVNLGKSTSAEDLTRPNLGQRFGSNTSRPLVPSYTQDYDYRMRSQYRPDQQSGRPVSRHGRNPGQINSQAECQLRNDSSRDPRREPDPPHRVLHSYNSPAYRNVPIWG